MKLSSQVTNNENVYDYIFSGLGASNSLIILSLLEDNLLLNKKIAIIEPSLKTINDKTYCFWAYPEDPIVIKLRSIIRHEYKNITINGGAKQDISTQPYYLIRSIDLYSLVSKKLENAKIPIFNCFVNEIVSSEDYHTLKTSNGSFKTQHVFNSVISKHEIPNIEEVSLHQSFYGLRVKCNTAQFQDSTFEMMNFNIDQNNYTQFLYTLPYSDKEALIELTRFGDKKVEIDYAKKLLVEQLNIKLGCYEILDEEIGCIPMTTYLHKPSVYNGVLNTGIHANLIKPSTGYGFKNMFHFAEMVKKEIMQNNAKNLNSISLTKKKRYQFYDTLLLIILLYWPKEGKKIFTKLFSSQHVNTIFSFLDEQTSIAQEINIFKSLPITPFLKSLVIYAQKKQLLRYIATSIILFAYFVISQYNQTIASYYSYSAIILGMFWVGIPHGALDHLTFSYNKKSLFKFIIKYLATILIYYFIWQILPSLSLLVFIIYSSFHFGESELQEIEIKVTSFTTYIKAFILGASILLFIIFTHIQESINIIANINGLEFIKLNEEIIVRYAIPTSLLAIFYLLLTAISNNKTSFYKLLTLLIIGAFTNLIIAFFLYFICQHSLNAWSHLKHQLKVNSTGLYKKALPHTISAFVILIVCILLNTNETNQTNTILPSFFIFIACISLPHFVFMHLFYNPK